MSQVRASRPQAVRPLLESMRSGLATEAAEAATWVALRTSVLGGRLEYIGSIGPAEDRESFERGHSGEDWTSALAPLILRARNEGGWSYRSGAPPDAESGLPGHDLLVLAVTKGDGCLIGVTAVLHPRPGALASCDGNSLRAQLVPHEPVFELLLELELRAQQAQLRAAARRAARPKLAAELMKELPLESLLACSVLEGMGSRSSIPEAEVHTVRVGLPGKATAARIQRHLVAVALGSTGLYGLPGDLSRHTFSPIESSPRLALLGLSARFGGLLTSEPLVDAELLALEDARNDPFGLHSDAIRHMLARWELELAPLPEFTRNEQVPPALARLEKPARKLLERLADMHGGERLPAQALHTLHPDAAYLCLALQPALQGGPDYSIQEWKPRTYPLVTVALQARQHVSEPLPEVESVGRLGRAAALQVRRAPAADGRMDEASWEVWGAEGAHSASVNRLCKLLERRHPVWRQVTDLMAVPLAWNERTETSLDGWGSGSGLRQLLIAGWSRAARADDEADHAEESRRLQALLLSAREGAAAPTRDVQQRLQSLLLSNIRHSSERAASGVREILEASNLPSIDDPVQVADWRPFLEDLLAFLDGCGTFPGLDGEEITSATTESLAAAAQAVGQRAAKHAARKLGSGGAHVSALESRLELALDLPPTPAQPPNATSATLTELLLENVLANALLAAYLWEQENPRERSACVRVHPGIASLIVENPCSSESWRVATEQLRRRDLRVDPDCLGLSLIRMAAELLGVRVNPEHVQSSGAMLARVELIARGGVP